MLRYYKYERYRIYIRRGSANHSQGLIWHVKDNIWYFNTFSGMKRWSRGLAVDGFECFATGPARVLKCYLPDTRIYLLPIFTY